MGPVAGQLWDRWTVTRPKFCPAATLSTPQGPRPQHNPSPAPGCPPPFLVWSSWSSPCRCCPAGLWPFVPSAAQRGRPWPPTRTRLSLCWAGLLPSLPAPSGPSQILSFPCSRLPRLWDQGSHPLHRIMPQAIDPCPGRLQSPASLLALFPLPRIPSLYLHHLPHPLGLPSGRHFLPESPFPYRI